MYVGIAENHIGQIAVAIGAITNLLITNLLLKYCHRCRKKNYYMIHTINQY